MNDQAARLRHETQKVDNCPSFKTFAVVSGKGGVGKSNFSLNFAISLIELGHKVLLFDMDIGMGNVDILMGKTADLTIVDFFEGRQPLTEIVSEGPGNLSYIAGGTGLENLVRLDQHLLDKFFDEIAVFFEKYDYVIFDMGAGLTEETLNFILSVDEIIVVTTPEPTSITDAYSMMKHIHLQDASLPFLIVVNRVIRDYDGIKTFKRLRTAARKFLGRDVKALGTIPEDKFVQQAVSSQTPFIFEEKSRAAKAVKKMAYRYEHKMIQDLPASSPESFLTKLKRLLSF